jgi:large subunit ribosomal protein L22
MESTATFKHLRITPRKLRRVVDLVRGKPVQQALDILQFDRKAASTDIIKLLKSAVANANQKGGVRLDSLYVKTIMVNPGPIMKRFTPRARGSASAIQKKTSHVTVVLDAAI